MAHVRIGTTKPANKLCPVCIPHEILDIPTVNEEPDILDLSYNSIDLMYMTLEPAVRPLPHDLGSDPQPPRAVERVPRAKQPGRR